MMTYRGFHARFTLPLLMLLILLALFLHIDPSVVVVLSVLSTIVIGFTFPWDAWAVRRQVWEFPPDRVWFRVGVLPIEEIAFFVLQTLIVGLLTAILLKIRQGLPAEVDLSTRTLLITGSIFAVAIVISIATRTWRRSHRSATYAWHLLAWFLPLIVAQWCIGYPVFVPRVGVIVLATMSIGIYLILADLVAIRKGIWYFDETQITGHRLAGVLPWEEAAFFVLTSLLVAQSTILFLPAEAR